MFLSTSSDLILFVGSICLLVTTGFVSWFFYEAARLLRQANTMVEDAREKMTALEMLVKSVSEKVGHLAQYAGFLAEGSQKVMSYLEHKQTKVAKPVRKSRGAEPSLDEIEEEE